MAETRGSRMKYALLCLIMCIGCGPNTVPESKTDGGATVTAHTISPPVDTTDCVLGDVQPYRSLNGNWLYIKYFCEEKLGKREAFIQFHNLDNCVNLQHKIVLSNVYVKDPKATK
jgi:hypothetical protein